MDIELRLFLYQAGRGRKDVSSGREEAAPMAGSGEFVPVSQTAAVVRNYYNLNAHRADRSRQRNAGYYREMDRLMRTVVLPEQKVLDIGCGNGDMLATLGVSTGVGIDISEEMIRIARRKHPEPALRFITGDAQDRRLLASLGTDFDVIIMRNSITEMHDVQSVFEALHEVCHQRTRIVIVSYSRVWQIPLQIADLLKIKVKSPVNNWLNLDMVVEMLELADFEVIRSFSSHIFPFNMGFLSRWLNRYIGNLPVINRLVLMFWIVARPLRPCAPAVSPPPSVTVVIPCRNEAGHVKALADRLPDLGRSMEVLWVEGNSTDDTVQRIEEVIAQRPGKDWRLLHQPGVGKGDAVRYAFARATGDILLILDADITVQPEDLPKFIDLLVSNKAEFVNGCRLVYPMDEKSMRFLNLLGNRFFAALFTYLLGQKVRDTLCGTKAMWHKDYRRIVAERGYFGDFDPFGDFDLLFGAARLNLRIVDLPVRYGERTYGTTNISRFRHGYLLLKMSAYAAKKLKFI